MFYKDKQDKQDKQEPPSISVGQGDITFGTKKGEITLLEMLNNINNKIIYVNIIAFIALLMSVIITLTFCSFNNFKEIQIEKIESQDIRIQEQQQIINKQQEFLYQLKIDLEVLKSKS